MCGIYGMVSLSGNHLRSPELAPSMAGTLRHRGPDGQGQWDAPDAILGAMRLRIIDRRPGTDQPYTSPSQKILVCNGEIYNGCEIRSRFPDHPYLSRTDVEPILPLIERYGTSGLSALDGMFAIAVWDTSSKRLYLARDRAGEKPLFYSRHRDEIWFASEIQTLLIHPEASRRIDQDALIDYLALSHVREPRTLFSSIQKVPAGQVIEFCAAGTREHAIDSPAGALTQTRRPPSPPVGESLLALIDRSVRNQLRSDVPVGVFLSGGMDSSLVTALAARHQPGLHTFTIRFPQHSYDESIYARRVAAEYHAYHHEVYATFDRLGYALDRLTSECAEPIADPAVVPTLLLAERAKEDVGVVLSGEGADELFGGYPTYLGHRWAKLTAWIPERFDPALRAVLSSPAASGARVPLAMLFDRFLKYRRTEYRARHLSWFGTGLFPYLSGTAQGVLLESLAEHRDPVEWAIRTDYRIYLREGMLTKLDRATMLSGLEARAPFLDRGVTSWAWATPSRDKVGLFGTKMSLRAAAAPVLPSWVLRRRKRGLSVPTAEWLNGTLRSAADRLLRPDYIAKQGLLPDLPFTRLLREHQEGRANHARALWPIVILQRWLEHWEGKSHDQRRGARSDARVHHV